MGLVEGLTEFLPVSSTGHLILAASVLDFNGPSVKVFEITIQTGAMLAVIWQYRQRLLATILGAARDAVGQRFALNILVAFLPAAVMGLLLGSWIKSALFQPMTVATALIVGGAIILWVERRARCAHARPSRIHTVDDITPIDALKIGLAQCAALIPGTSRSGATIIGSMIFGLSRPAATEFSFHLGVPTLLAASAYSLWSDRDILRVADVPVFLVGIAFSFASALVCIRWLIRYVSSHDFSLFGWYRIVFGALVLVVAMAGSIP